MPAPVELRQPEREHLRPAGSGDLSSNAAQWDLPTCGWMPQAVSGLPSMALAMSQPGWLKSASPANAASFALSVSPWRPAAGRTRTGADCRCPAGPGPCRQRIVGEHLQPDRRQALQRVAGRDGVGVLVRPAPPASSEPSPCSAKVVPESDFACTSVNTVQVCTRLGGGLSQPGRAAAISFSSASANAAAAGSFSSSASLRDQLAPGGGNLRVRVVRAFDPTHAGEYGLQPVVVASCEIGSNLCSWQRAHWTVRLRKVDTTVATMSSRSRFRAIFLSMRVRPRCSARPTLVQRPGGDETQCATRRRIVGEQHVAGDLLLHEPRVGLVGVERADHVVAVRPGVEPRPILIVAVRLGEVGHVQPVPRPALAVARRRQQPIDQLARKPLAAWRCRRRTHRSPPASAAARCRSKVTRRISVRRSASRRRRQPFSRQFGEDERVDRIPDFGLRIADRGNGRLDDRLERPPVAGGRPGDPRVAAPAFTQRTRTSISACGSAADGGMRARRLARGRP